MFGCGTSLHNCVIFSIWDPEVSHLGARYRGSDWIWGLGVEAEKSEEDQGIETGAFEVA